MRFRFRLGVMAVAWRTDTVVEPWRPPKQQSVQRTTKVRGAPPVGCLRATWMLRSGCCCYRVACVTLLDFSTGRKLPSGGN
jgi:hypothetical protein